MNRTPSRAARATRGASRLGLGVAALIAIAAIAITLVIVRFRNMETPLDPDLVAVAPFANETGDATLEPLGRLAAERITQGIQQHRVTDVVPPAVAVAAAAEAEEATDRVRAFAEATGAGVVLHGAYYLLGDSLQFQLQITDAAEATVLAALHPMTGPSDPATESLNLVRERVLGTLAAALDVRAGSAHIPMQPPSLEMYRVMQQATVPEARGDMAEALRIYRQAWATDSSFYPAMWMVAGLTDDPAEQDSLYRLLDGYRDQMSEAERLLLQIMRGPPVDPDADLQRLRRLAELVPWWWVAAGETAWRVHRPRESLELLARADTTNPYFPIHEHSYWRAAGESRHILGQYEEELELALAARHQAADRHTVPDYDDAQLLVGPLRPLAALGRIDDFNLRLDTILALPPWTTPWGAVRTPAGYVLLEARELRAHGHRDAAHQALERVIAWYEARPAEEIRQAKSTYGYVVAVSLYGLERWEEARTAFEAVLAEGGRWHADALAGLGAVAVRLGDADAARAISAQLAEQRGGEPLGRARIAALLGEREEAVRLLREAFDAAGHWGLFIRQRHQDMDFESLRGYQPFELLMRPRG
jgi:tetratricopeptide (TPR) repeat protein